MLDAKEIKPGVWEIERDGETTWFWINASGIFSHRVKSKTASGRTISHAPQRIGFDEMLAKTEKQLTMF